MSTDQEIIKQYLRHISSQDFPCIGAKASVTKGQTDVIVAENICCPNDDIVILNFLYNFIDNLRNNKDLFQSASILFRGPSHLSEDDFEKFLWMRLQSLTDLDATKYGYAKDVSDNPESSSFCYSIKAEPFFVLTMHSGSKRDSRKFDYPVIVFNSHVQFEALKESGAYDKMQDIIRKRDVKYSGSVNPMLSNFGERSSAFQISGKEYENNWECPLKSNYKKNE